MKVFVAFGDESYSLELAQFDNEEQAAEFINEREHDFYRVFKGEEYTITTKLVLQTSTEDE